MTNIKSITGKIEVIGESSSNKGTDVMKAAASVKKYDYIRILDATGNVQMIKGAFPVGPSVDSYLFAGTEGTFHFFEINGEHLFFAYENDERKVFDLQELIEYNKSYKKLRNAGLWLIIGGIPMIIVLGLGLILIGIGGYLILKMKKLQKLTKPDNAASYLRDKGFAVV